MDAGKFWRFWNFRVKLGVKMDVVGWFGFPIAKVRAVKDAQFAIIGAKRETLTGEADGPGAGFQQEGRRPRGGDAQGSSGPMLYLRGIMPSMLRVRPARKVRPTPKGEASSALRQAEACVHELETFTSPDQKEWFIRRLNEFLATGRKVTEFLPKEAGRSAGLRQWVKSAEYNLRGSDSRYGHFCTLRTISVHDCVVRPDAAMHSVEITEQLRLSGHCEVDLHDPKTGKITGRGIYDGPVGAESVHQETVIRTKYFFTDRQDEDIVTFCKEILNTLRDFTTQVYDRFP